MAAFRIELDGADAITVNLDGLDLFKVHVHASLYEAAPAQLLVFGGSCVAGVAGMRYWRDGHVFLPGQSIKVSLIDSDGPCDEGRTMAELRPGELSEEDDLATTGAKAAELKARPRLREAFSIRVETSAGAQCSVHSGPVDDHFLFSVAWDDTRPTQARVSARTSCVEDVSPQEDKECLRGRLSMGESVTCLVRV